MAFFGGTVGSIDGTAHLRTRVHPRQAEWYRRDKGNHDDDFDVTLLIYENRI